MKLVVVVASGLHIGYLGCYGNEWISTPNLDRLASESVVFDQHIAANPEHHAARRIWQAGRYFFPAPNLTEAIHPTSLELSNILQEHGVVTGRIRAPARPEKAAPVDALKGMLKEVGRKLVKWAEHEHWLLDLEIDTFVAPWDVPEDLLDRGDQLDEGAEEEPRLDEKEPAFISQQNHYAAAAIQFDRWVGQFLEVLDEHGLADIANLLITTDGGQSVGEHALLSPTWSSLHEEIIHIPFILHLPGRAEAGRRVFALTQPVDLYPTFCEWFGITPPSSHGHSLVPLLLGKAGRIREYACGGLCKGDSIEWALRTLQWCLLVPVQPPPSEEDRHPLLYVKPDDRWEFNDLHQHNLEWVERLELTLRSFVEATRAPDPFQPPALPDFIAVEETEAGGKGSKQSDGGSKA